MIVPAALTALEKRKQSLLKSLKTIEQEIATEQSKIVIACSSCGVQRPIGDVVYIQTHWYVRPYSCTGGDYWNEGEGNFKCLSCGFLNRLYDREEYQKLKYRFKEIFKTY